MIYEVGYLLSTGEAGDLILAKNILRKALETASNHRGLAAAALGCNRRTLARWLVKAEFKRDLGGPRSSRRVA